ncbi:hypothetical protein LTR78_002165 [Recurvomyces mirabilis]|uniref:Uncharacterized protein n=1 Tax=Recurvomyces mirabilis TaxID=574656 RepID=A0AAE0WTW0_9PEZI|nr:hypothetical protein LTR78_002165 [Recurvomyces mirabilis]KAK5160622.1 hypothetical protein LTS14_001634 [Recurvomyces mirabilis]
MPPKASKKAKKSDEPEAIDLKHLSTPSLTSQELCMSYRIARVPIAENSSKNLWSAFEYFLKTEDFVGADMARKFIQMGMTRAKRYANHKGGKKYDRSEREVTRDSGERVELAKSEGHQGREEKLAASEVFKAVWRRCTSDERYLELKKEFLEEQKVWDRQAKRGVKKEEIKGEEVSVKKEGDD